MRKLLLLVLAGVLLPASARAAIAIDKTVSKDQGSAANTVATAAFTTTSTNELLLAFISTDATSSGTNIVVNSVTTAGLTWTLVGRTNTQRGTAEIWRSFAPAVLTSVTVSASLSQSAASSLTVMTFTGVDTTGTNGSGAIGAVVSGSKSSGAPTASLVTTRNSSWVFGVGNDWDKAVARTPASGQTVVHSYLPPAGDTYWVQELNAPTPTSGTTVTLSDTAPTTDQYNLTIVEVRAPATTTTTITSSAGTPQSATVNTPFGTNLQATVKDASNNPIVGTTVTFAVPASGAGGSFAGGATTAVTNSSGVATAAAFTANTIAGAYTVTASASGVAAPANFLLTNIAGSAATVTATAGATQSATINSPFATNLQVTVKDSFGNAVSGALVTFGAPASGASGSFAGGVNTATTNAAGVATAGQFTANGSTGSYSVTAGVSGATAASFSLTNNNLASPASISATGGNSQSAKTNSAFTSNLQATVRDASSNPVSGVTVTFSAPGAGAGGTFSGGNTAVTNSSGIATAGTFTANSTAGSYAVTASVSGVSTPASFNLTNTPGAAAAVAATAGTPQSATVSAAFATNLQVTVKDGGNNGVPGVTVTFAAPPSGASGTFAGGVNTAITSSSGVATAPAFTANAVAGTYTVTATVAGLTPASFSLTNNPASSAGIKLLQSNATGNEAGTSNMSLAFTSSNTAGDFLIVTGTAARPASTITVSDTLGNTYLTAFGPVTDAAQNVTMYVWYVPVCKGGSNTVTITPSATAALEIHVSEWSGLATTSPVDKTTSATGTGSTVSSGAVTPSINGELIFGYGWVANTASAGATFTPLSLINGDLDEYQVQSTAGSVAATFSQTSGTWLAAIVTFKPSGGWSIAGTVSGGAGATVTLNGPAGGVTTADSSGNYSFAGLPAGNYTVTPTKTNVTFSPASTGVSITSANVTGVNFAVVTYTISGVISGPAGATVTLSGAASAVTTSNASGNYSFVGLLNGNYTVTPSQAGLTYNPPNQAVTLSGANATALNFSVVTYSLSGNISGGAGANVALSGAASASTTADTSGNYAFAGLLNGSYTVTPTKAGSTFSPSSQPAAVSGANVTGVNFAALYSISGTITGGASATVTLSGAASAVTTADGNGNFSFTALFAGGYTVTPTMANTTFTPASSGVQITSANVTGVNFAVVKYTISGIISGPLGATVTLSGAASATTTSDASGNYTFAGLLNGNYAVTPSKSGFVFSPLNQPVTINGANATAINFSAPTYSISGNISGGAGASVALSGAASANATADVSGNYTFSGLPNGGYAVTPTKAGSTFSPPSQPVTVSGASLTGINFAALYSISGTIAGGSGATVTLSGDASATTTADGGGNYSLTGLVAGNYIVTPTMANATFNPASIAVSLTNAGATGVNFAVVTYTISGVISGPVGATVTLSGAASAVTTADASGNYTFTGLLNGSYTVTPSKTGFVFNPPNQAVTLSGVNATAINFAAPTYTIGGTVTGGAAATMTLTGAGSATVTADASGNYSFAGLGNGSYTVTPTKSGYSFTPVSQPATINSANVQGINFTTAALPTLAIDATAFGDLKSSATSVTTAAFSTKSPNEVLLAFVGADVSTASGTNNSVSSITTAGLTWVLVRRNNTERGTAEIWSAFASTTLSNVTAKANLAISAVSSITVVSFAGANTSGTNGSGAIGATASGNGTTGAPTANLKTTANNSLVIGVGEDWNAAPTVTPGANQTMIHLLPLSGLNTFWVQRQSALTAAAGTTVTINDTAPTTDMYNLVICEVLGATTGSGPSTYSISGTISPTAGGAGATVALSGAATASTVTGSDGSYSFAGLANGTYTLTPSNAGYTFSPTSQTLTVNNANITGANFTAAAQGPTYTISGTISPVAGGAGATVALSGAATASTVTGSDGSYSFAGLANGTYTLTPRNSGYTFSPTSQTLTVNNANITGANFTASVQGPTYTISGTISPVAGGAGATVALSGAATASTVTGSDGSYSFAGLANGTYTLTPSNGGYAFSPTSQTLTVSNANITGANFTAAAQGVDTISGTVTSSGSGAQVTLRNTATANAPTIATATADVQGNYSFPGLPAGTYSVTPGRSGYAFGPTTQQVSISSTSVSNVNFTATVVPITISPVAATLLTSQTQQFTATVTGATNTSVTWTASGGSISSGGLFTAPNSAGTYIVTATSVADTTKSASASVDVILPASTSLLLGDENVESQADATLPLGQAEAFLVSANKSGSLQSLTVYLDPASNVTSLSAGLYADNNGHPGSLLVQGTITQLVAGAWNPIIVPATPVVGGTNYWVALLGSNSGTLVFREGTSGGCSGEVSSQTNLTSLAPTWTTGAASSNCPLSVFGDSAKVFFYDTFAGTTISPMWTAISRHGEYAQSETECNIPQQVAVNNGLTITAAAQSWSCGDFSPPSGAPRTAPAPWSYITGDVQWSTLNFTYGTVEIRAKFPSSTTSLWPATWLLGSNCQLANIFTGDTGIGGSCPNLGASAYTEIDMTECIGTNWCQLNIANPSFNIGGGCNNITYHIDANYHTFTTVWNSSGITQYYDTSSVSNCNSNLNQPMFLIMQIQTGGVAGTPNNSALPASLLIEHVKVTQP